MAKRFGRQQKRRMKAEIDRLEYQCVKVERDLYHLKRQYAHFHRTIDIIREVLGPKWFGLPPEPMSIQPNEGWDVQMPGFVAMADMDVREAQQTFVTIERVLLSKLSFKALTDMRKQMHVTLSWGGQRYAYSVSQEALAAMPQEYLEQMIIEELAQYASHEIKRAVGEVRHGTL